MKKTILLVLSLIYFASVSAIEVCNLRTEMLTNPEGIDIIHPHVSWMTESNARNVVQTAYQIMVASSPEKLNAGQSDIWNSGKIVSNQSINVLYGGTTLQSGHNYYWKVKIWTNKGESDWSQPAQWSMGLLHKADWQGEWIGLDKAFPWDKLVFHSRLSARYFRKEFDVNHKKTIKQATAYIIGLGMYKLYINGEKIGSQVLSPSPTNYDKDVKYNTFDVTTAIRQGDNVIGVVLGNGRYFNMRQNYKPQKIKTFGFPKMLFQLQIEYTDGTSSTIVSDGTWKVTPDGPIRSDNEWDGEEYDATKELTGWDLPHYNTKKWLPAELVSAPTGIISAQMNPNMAIHESVKPVAIHALPNGAYVLDMGQNMAGWLALKAQGQKGDTITLRFAETLNPDGSINRANLRSALQTDVYIMNGKGVESWQPSFVYHGFRYVEITGYPGVPTLNDFEGKVIYDGFNTIGSFTCSDSLLDKIYHNAFWSIRSDYKGMPVDCPQRDERQPWLGDRASGCIGESFIFDNENLYIKWLDDIMYSQKPDGQLPDMAPAFYKTYYSDNMTWPGTYLMVANMLYDQFGDSAVIKKHYPHMKQWLSYMKTHYMKDYLLTKDKYGDWCVPPKSKTRIHSIDPARLTSGELISTAYYYYFMQLMEKFAKISGNEQDIPAYIALAANIKTAFNQKFYNKETYQYGNNTVTANLLPLAFGMVNNDNENAVFHQMLDKIVNQDKMHISTGVIGTQWLLQELTQQGRTDVAFRIATQKDYPSWGYMVENGATTTWELWDGNTASPKMSSRNHVMLLGDLIAWMYEDLAGIQTHPNHPGFKWLVMEPHPAETLKDVSAQTMTPYGVVKSAWTLHKGIFTWHVSIPANTRANLLIPASTVNDITENGNPVMKIEGIKFVRVEDYRINLEIGSGDYTFVCKYGEAQNRWKAGIIADEFINKNAPYPECHAATIAQATNGNLVAAWFGGTKERNPDVCIWVSRRVNGKWTPGENVANGIINDTLRYACWNPVLYQVPGGELQLYYKVGPNTAKWKGKLIVSHDGGITWSKPQDLPAGFLGPIKDKPVLLKNGTLIAPSSTESGGWKIHFELTKNFGKTWKYAEPVDGNNFQAIQPTILVHKNGELQMLCRTTERTIAESWSKNNGKTWSPLEKTSLPNNNSGIDAVTLRNGYFLLVYNHVLPPANAIRGKGARSPLNIAVSPDGKTWYAAVVLEDSPIGQYSYPSVIQSSDGNIQIVYTWRRKAIKYVEIDPTKLIFSKIENEQWPSDSETKEINIVNLHRYKVSVCDWMILKRQKLGAIDLAKEIGTDGVEVDMGGLGKKVDFANKLNQKKVQEEYIGECNRLGMQISSIAMSAFYGQSFATRPNYEQLVDECISVMKALKVKVAFLPLGDECDKVKHPDLYPIILQRLKVIAKKAEAAGVVIGIDTSIPAKAEAELIDQVGSPAIRCYVNFSTILKRHGNICKDLKTLGKDRIIQIHATNTDGYWLQNDPRIDMAKIKETLDKMGWSGWLVLERSRDTKDVHNVKWNYSANAAYLKKIFQQSIR
ncbi:alpha-L-rhamnosidase [Microbacter margulisiae]|uniref:alpha-L-rhamnosidase n=1 Tax=Microbacter margulisiae TaxID=1350067 RepID=A0A7W5DRQ8_9PORP|nr:family 78 glycoside hydrolase catalytic domain [Microbacter margulisiae]MBB3187003.1 alpha-L-rhamnosidase [Microbacter margulisiae]